MPVVTKAQLENATIDVATLSDVVNGSDTINGTGNVTSRLGTVNKSLKKITTELSAIDIATLAATAINSRVDAIEAIANQFDSTVLLLKPSGLLNWNSADITGGEITLSGDKKTITPVAGNNAKWVRTTQKLPIRGKYYAEFNSMATLTGCLYGGLGVLKTAIAQDVDCNSSILGSWRQYCHGGLIADGTIFQFGGGATTGRMNQNFTSGQRFAIAVDMTNGKIWFGDGSSWDIPAVLSGCNPTTGANPHVTFVTGDNVYIAGAMYNGPADNPPWKIASIPTGILPAGYASIN